MKSFIVIIIILITFQACNKSNSSNAGDQADIHQIIVKEVLQTSQYTYILADQDNQDLWLAAPGTQVETGLTYYYRGGLIMLNFKSRELERVFDKIVFIEEILSEPPSIQEKTGNANLEHNASVLTERKDISVETAEGGITIAGLFSEKESYAGKSVRISGMVTKFNSAIMGKNWIHIQDGTDYDGHFDLTVTSDVTVITGEIVTFEGVIILDRDFGSGYFYDVIMEEGRIVE